MRSEPFGGESRFSARCLAALTVVIVGVIGSSASYGADRDLPLQLLREKRFTELNELTTSALDAYKKNTDSEDRTILYFGAFGTRDTDIAPMFDEWIKAFPNSAGAYFARARFRYEMAWMVRGHSFISEIPKERIVGMEDWIARVVSDLNQARSLEPKQAAFSYLLIRAYRTIGDDAGRSRELAFAISLDPQTRWTRYEYMTSLYPEWGGGYVQMERFLDKTRKLPDTPKMKKTKAHLAAMIEIHRANKAYQREDFLESVRYARNAVAVDRDRESLTVLGNGLVKVGRFDEAIGVLSEAIDLSPELASLRHGPREQRGYAFEKAGRLKEAFDDYLICAKSNNVWGQFAVGVAYAKGKGVTENHAEAVHWLSLAATGGDKTAPEWLEWLRARESR